MFGQCGSVIVAIIEITSLLSDFRSEGDCSTALSPPVTVEHEPDGFLLFVRLPANGSLPAFAGSRSGDAPSP